jgi:hypothetical protein
MTGERITPYGDSYTINQRVDEVVAHGKDVHIEMLSEDCAFMAVGADIFTIYVKGGKLFIAWRENEGNAPVS